MSQAPTEARHQWLLSQARVSLFTSKPIDPAKADFWPASKNVQMVSDQTQFPPALPQRTRIGRMNGCLVVVQTSALRIDLNFVPDPSPDSGTDIPFIRSWDDVISALGTMGRKLMALPPVPLNRIAVATQFVIPSGSEADSVKYLRQRIPGILIEDDAVEIIFQRVYRTQPTAPELKNVRTNSIEKWSTTTVHQITQIIPVSNQGMPATFGTAPSVPVLFLDIEQNTNPSPDLLLSGRRSNIAFDYLYGELKNKIKEKTA